LQLFRLAPKEVVDKLAASAAPTDSDKAVVLRVEKLEGQSCEVPAECVSFCCGPKKRSFTRRLFHSALGEGHVCLPELDQCYASSIPQLDEHLRDAITGAFPGVFSQLSSYRLSFISDMEGSKDLRLHLDQAIADASSGYLSAALRKMKAVVKTLSSDYKALEVDQEIEEDVLEAGDKETGW
jgi:hypothetical protein